MTILNVISNIRKYDFLFVTLFLSGLIFSAILSSVCVNTKNPLLLFLDLGSHWMWLGLALSIVLALFSKFRAQNTWTPVFGVFTVIFTVFTVGMYPVYSDRVTANPSLRVATSNVLYGNKHPELLLNWAKEEKLDVVGLEEVTDSYMQSLKADKTYPYKYFRIPDKAFSPRLGIGMGILSKYPLSNTSVVQLKDEPPILVTDVQWNEKTITFTVVHPVPPYNAQWAGNRNDLLKVASITSNARNNPVVLVGDFNATPWSAGVKIVEKQGLSRAETPLPTWPAKFSMPFPMFLTTVIPIDHIMISPHWNVVSSQRGDFVGSDHLPVVAELQLR